MRCRNILGITLLLGTAASLVSADVLWDNYITQPDGYDGVTFFSSEADASVSDSWAVDDAIFSYDVTIQSIQWFGARKPGYTYTAEVIVMDEEFIPVQGSPVEGLSYAAATRPEPFNGFEVYEGSLELDEPLELPAGRYYIGVRLRNEIGLAPGGGRNFVLTTGDGTTRGETMGAFRSPDFGYTDWTYTEGYDPAPIVTDFAYRINGIPEPAGLALLLTGLLFRRR